jgi:hypothetical protein
MAMETSATPDMTAAENMRPDLQGAAAGTVVDVAADTADPVQQPIP